MERDHSRSNSIRFQIKIQQWRILFTSIHYNSLPNSCLCLAYNMYSFLKFRDSYLWVKGTPLSTKIYLLFLCILSSSTFYIYKMFLNNPNSTKYNDISNRLAYDIYSCQISYKWMKSLHIYNVSFWNSIIQVRFGWHVK